MKMGPTTDFLFNVNKLIISPHRATGLWTIIVVICIIYVDTLIADVRLYFKLFRYNCFFTTFSSGFILDLIVISVRGIQRS